MYLDRLRIVESDPAERVVRSITFKKGMNLIVDTRKGKHERGNGIGKTTSLKLIDICLGAKDRKYIYYDDELDQDNLDLKEYINESKVYAELTLKKSYSEQSSLALRVDLFENGRRYIDGEKYAFGDFNRELNSILFNVTNDKPSFRQLVKMFVRINQKNDNDKLLKFLDGHTSHDVYKNVYSFLFRLGDVDSEERLLELKKKAKELRKDISKLKALNNIKDIDAVEQQLISTQKDIDRLKLKREALVDINALKRNEDKLADVRSEYSLLADSIDSVGFRIERFRSIINEAIEEKTNNLVDESVLKVLFDETTDAVPKLQKDFDQLVQFNEQLLQNKIDYFSSNLDIARDELDSLLTARKELLNKYQDVVVLIKDNDVGSYVSVQAEIEEKLRNKGRFEKVVELHSSLVGSLESCNEEIEKLGEIKTNPKNQIAKFNEFFKEYSEKVTKEQYLLHLKDGSFPLGMRNLGSGLSTGTKKSVISAFDLAYQSYSRKEEIARPSFIVHDVIETMDEVGLNNTMEIVNKVGCQYVVAVLSQKINSVENTNKQDVVLELSEKDKLFHI